MLSSKFMLQIYLSTCNKKTWNLFPLHGKHSILCYHYHAYHDEWCSCSINRYNKDQKNPCPNFPIKIQKKSNIFTNIYQLLLSARMQVMRYSIPLPFQAFLGLCNQRKEVLEQVNQQDTTMQRHNVDRLAFSIYSGQESTSIQFAALLL